MSGNQQPQQYCLRWNNHQHNLLSVFEDLLNHEAFVDVTLAVEGLQLKAHKMVLSACSPYFQSMLYNTPDRHPIVFLRDVRYSEMKALLEFMYRGEVSVDQENLSSLLKVAEGLKIKGLAEVQECKESKQSPVHIPPPSSSSPSVSSAGITGGSTNSLSGAAGYLSALTGLTGLLSPDHLVPHLTSPLKRMASSPLVNPPPPPPPNPPSSSASNFSLGPKRKRGRPRRLSGSEAVPLASGLSDAEINDENRCESKNHKELPERSESTPPDCKSQDFTSEADSIDGRSSGELLTPKKEEPSGGEEVVSSPISPKSPQTLMSGNGGKLGHNNTNEPKSMSEMSVRGLDLLRYADISQNGTYRCRECEKLKIIKNFKNKYSFQRHAFLYHEGSSRKVFPCSICHKEFSRPDKMKQHLKVAHDCVIPTKNSSKNSSNNVADLGKIEEGHPPATLLVNPFLQHLNDPTSTEGKIESCKVSGSRVK